jgi:uncharacterized protein with FMN-binding domain
MNSKPKILVFGLREVIYTILLAVFALLLVICLILMFTGRTTTRNTDSGQETQIAGAQQNDNSQTGISQQTDSSQTDSLQQTATVQDTVSQAAASVTTVSAARYTPGIYTVPLYLEESSPAVEVTVDADHINSIRLVNLSETTKSLYPLMSPSLDHIATQILQRQTLDGITSPQENRYTSQFLMNAISDALELAQS